MAPPTGTSPDAVERVRRAHDLLAATRYLTLATAGADGTPWASPVWFAVWQRPGSAGALSVDLVWLSRPESLHSQNIARRPEVGISIFDSTQPADSGVGLQLLGRARLVPSDRLDAAADVFSRASLTVGGQAWPRERMEEPAPLRLYAARVEGAFVLGGGERHEVPTA